MNVGLGSNQYGLTEEKIELLSRSIGTVFLEEWGGPRSPLALQFLHETIIPDLVHCFRHNADILTNGTFLEIIGWKLKTQFAYPSAVASGLAGDLLKAVRGIIDIPQITDPKEPWKRIFRLWVSGESLPNISERTGYPLDYLDLLLIRFKKLQKFVAGRGASVLECVQNEELREFGWEQLSFLYQFYSEVSSEPLYKERLALEQVIYDLGLPLEVSDLVALLEIIHANEGKLDRVSLLNVLRDTARKQGSDLYLADQGRLSLLPGVLKGLLAIHWLQENKTGKLTLSEKSAKTISGFLVPKLSIQVLECLAGQDKNQAREILLRQNPEVLVKFIDWAVREVNPGQAAELLTGIYKQINRMLDLHLIHAMGKIGKAYDFLIGRLEDRDSLIRAKACEAIGNLGNKEGTFLLLRMLQDPVAGVRERAVIALGQLEAVAAVKNLEELAQDYGESLSVRESAAEALRQIQNCGR